MKKLLNGNLAVSIAVALSKVDVIAAYPITPQTSIIEKLASMCERGEITASFIRTESEHSSMACCFGAALSGARVFTTTSSQGIVLMHEMLHWVSGSRLPVVMVNVSRALGPPWSLWVDHTDSLSQRDTGWIQIYCSNNQEVLDTTIQAFRIAEEINIPVMVNMDGFLLSHTFEPVDVPSAKKVDIYLKRRRKKFEIQKQKSISFGGVTYSDDYYIFRKNLQIDFEKTRDIIEKCEEEFQKIFGRKYGMIEKYSMDDADIVVVTMGSLSGTVKDVIDRVRARDVKAGLLRIRVFNPMPANELRENLGNKKIAVIDRNLSPGKGGIVCQELKSILFDSGTSCRIFGFIGGLGGKDISPSQIEDIILYTYKKERPEKDILWIS